MKKILRVSFIIIIMLSAIATFAFVRMQHHNAPEADGRLISRSSLPAGQSEEQGRTLVIADGDFAMQTGQSHQCTARFDNGSSPRGIIWSSTDESVATVDSSGRVNAAGAGDAEIWAVISRELKAHVSVSVYSDLNGSAAEAITALAADGSDISMNRVSDMAAKLSRAKSKSTLKTAALLLCLAEFKALGAGGGQDPGTLWEQLGQKLRETGIDTLTQDTLRQAALAAYCQGEKSAADITLSFTGDCTFGYFNGQDKSNQFPAVYSRSGSVTYPFDLTREVFGADDVTMINFEGTLTDSCEHKQKQFYFRGEPSYIDILTNSSVEAVTVENNHSFDYLDTGFNDTIDTMRDAGIRYTTYHSPAVINVNGCRVVMLSMSMIGVNYSEEFREHVDNFIRQYKRNDTIIVMNVHWGAELEKIPEPRQIEAAHAMIDSGVDLIIGHHPHVLQGVECYNGRYIAYSLGNFSFGGNTSAGNPSTVILRVSFARTEKGGLALKKISAVPCYTTSSGSKVNNYQPVPLFGDQGQAVMEKLAACGSELEGGVQSLNWHGIP